MIKRLLPIYLAAVFGALVGTFWATPYEEVQEETAPGPQLRLLWAAATTLKAPQHFCTFQTR